MWLSPVSEKGAFMDLYLTSGVQPDIIRTKIAEIQRTQLENTQPSSAIPLWGQLEGLDFFHIRGIKASNKGQNLFECINQTRDLLLSLNAINAPFYFLLINIEHRLNVYLACGDRKKKPDLVKMLKAIFPGISLMPNPEQELGSYLNKTGIFNHRGMISGLPKVISEKTEWSGAKMIESQKGVDLTVASPLDRMARGLQAKNWGFYVYAQPVNHNDIRIVLSETSETLGHAVSMSKMQVQKLVQESVRETEQRQTGSTVSLSGERNDRSAKYLADLLELKEKQLQLALIEGAWNVEAHFFSDQIETLLIQNALLRSGLHAAENSYEPVRSFICATSPKTTNYDYSTLLNSSELASMAYLPSSEAPGYFVNERIDFDVDQIPEEGKCLELGNIVSNHQATALTYNVPIQALTKHTFVCGMTGSGKTTTVKTLLVKLTELNPKVPFLVIEPTKTEYRELLSMHSKIGDKINLMIFTLGDESTNPLRLNPFQFEFDKAGNTVNVQTHIDYLKTVFNAAFALYPPMPYILEICLHEIYEDRGWNLITNKNDKLSEAECQKLDDYHVFPTLGDLYKKVDEVTHRMGYSHEVEQDVKAALQTRLESLMTGGKGMMLNTPLDAGMDFLLNQNTVLELEKIGDDEQKAFIMGILLTRLYEYRQVQRETKKQIHEFQHLTVIEEAHRLIKAPNNYSSPDFPEASKQAVETFANMLSEVRAFGEGIMIVEQIPSKLIPDALKNTNLKIMHRLVPEDEREILRGMVNMSKQQSSYLVTIPVGEAVIHSHTDDQPVLVRVMPGKDSLSHHRPSDEELRGLINRVHQPVMSLNQKQKLLEMSRNYQVTRRLNSNKDFKAEWHKAHINLFLGAFDDIGISKVESIDNLTKYSSIESYERGLNLGWSYSEIGEFERLRSNCLSQLNTDSLNHLKNWYLTKQSSKKGPFGSCSLCESNCILKFDVMGLMKVLNLKRQFEGIELDSQECIDSILNINVSANNSNVISKISLDTAICILNHLLEERHSSIKNQIKTLDKLIVYHEEGK